MRSRFFWWGAAAALIASSASAQDEVLRGETVMQRPRPDYDPIGQRLGGFILLPDLGIQESYSSNIFATPSNTTDDFITSIEPALDLKSNWNNHALNFHADGRIVKYADNNRENFNDYTLGGGGRLDIQRDARLFAGMGYKVRHEPRSSPNDLGGTEPTEYSDLSASLAGEKDFNRLSFRLDAAYDQYSYSDVRNGLGALIPMSRRDYDEKSALLRTAYEFLPQSQIYILAGYNLRDYDSSTDIFGFDRSSHGYTLALGARYDVTGIFFVDGFAGYRRQDYDDSRLSAMSGPTGGLRLTWNVTRLTTLTGEITREVRETVISGSSGYFDTSAQTRVDHELLRNLILSARVGYENDDFQGISRNDNYLLVGPSAKYLIDRNFTLSGGYDFRRRSSDQPGADFNEHLVAVRVNARL